MTITRAAWFSLGALSLAFGGIGIVLPLLPTTPFILLAAYAFSKSSARWHSWLIQHRRLGPMIRNWNDHGAISSRVKLYAVTSMLVVIVLSVLLGVSKFGLIAQGIVLPLCALFILTRPQPPADA